MTTDELHDEQNHSIIRESREKFGGPVFAGFLNSISSLVYKLTRSSLDMSTSLYQKYRPQQFSEVVGQDHIRTTLLNELSSNTATHAYLFSGPRGIGKTTMARLLARSINCVQRKKGEPCNECNACTLIQQGKALDLIEIDAASYTGVDHVRENIIDNARVAPSILEWKVFIIDEVHMLSTSAFNALLKTLEEPPAKTMFILATTEIHKVPSTIISRCEQFHFRRVSLEQTVDRLIELAKKEGITVDLEVAEAIAKRSEGSLRDAESLLGQVLVLDDKHITVALAEIVLPHSEVSEMVALLEEIVRNQTAPAIARVNQLLDSGVMLLEFTKDFIEFLRKVLLYLVQDSLEPLEYLDINKDALERITTIAQELNPRQLSEMIQECMNVVEQSKDASIPQLPLELAIVKLTHAGQKAAQRRSARVEPPQASDHTSRRSAQLSMQNSAPSQRSQHKKARNNAAPTRVQAKSGELTLDSMKEQWGEVLKAMKEKNHGLYLSMQVAHLVSVENDTLTLGVEYKFYQDRFLDVRNIRVIDEVLYGLFHTHFDLEILLGKEYAVKPALLSNIEQPSDEEVANVWDLAASGFGSKS